MAPIDDRDFWNIVRRESAPRYDGADDARAELAILMIARRFADRPADNSGPTCGQRKAA
jgi:hypothetical protein